MAMNEPVQTPPAVNLIDNGNPNDLMGVNVPENNQQTITPEQTPAVDPLTETPYKSVEQLVEGYKNLQRFSTQTSQRASDLEQRYNQAVDTLMQTKSQPVQSQQTNTLMELPQEQFLERLKSDAKGTMAQLSREVASEQAKTMLAPMQEQLQATQYLYNQQALSQTLDNIEAKYSTFDPNYQQNLNAAIELVTGDWATFAQNNPAKALNDAYDLVLGQQLRNPEFLTKLNTNFQNQQQQTTLQKQMAAPVTGGGNVFQPPHAPATFQQQQQGQQPLDAATQARMLAHQIAMYDEPQFFNPSRGTGLQFQVNETNG